MTKQVPKPYSSIYGASARVTVLQVDKEPEYCEIQIVFSEGSVLTADYWRVLKEGREVVSSFDHKQRYGLTAPVNAIQELDKLLDQHRVTEVRINNGTGDLIIDFSSDIQLQVFGFTAYEAWTLHQSNGRIDYSNHSK